ncbi:tripartite motif-containing protein 16-like [Polypterus senegalus]|uniref:tripartite motif-containing protein 16-like n=1 Tax=Polypterus senegalus TaxID=55291 RepID=UPI001963D93C|nr:tripartite motif-containing protein 16-like [Polypterus senegalus]
MASFCESHLQQHRESQVLKRHRVEVLSENLKDKLCRKHHRVLEIFCRTDGTCICSMCAATDHKHHDTVTLETERAEKQSNTEMELQEQEETFRSVLESIEQLRSKVTEVIKDYEQRKVRKTEKIIEQLEKEIGELKKRDVELAKLLQIDDDICFLKKFESPPEERDAPITITKKEVLPGTLFVNLSDLKNTLEEISNLESVESSEAGAECTDKHSRHLKENISSLCVPDEDEDLLNTTLNGELLPERLKKDLCDLKKSLEEIRGWEFVETIETGVGIQGLTLQNLQTRNGLIKYSCPLTLDPNTVNPRLHLSEDNKKVTDKGTVTLRRDHPNRFRFQPQVLCREALSGTRCYWEVVWTGIWADIGVAYKGIERRGWNEECHLGQNDKSWCLCCSHSRYFVRHNKMETQICTPSSNRIGVYLDCPTGSLSFYSISDTMTLLHSFNISFTEPLYLGFGVGLDSSVTICPLNPSDQ